MRRVAGAAKKLTPSAPLRRLQRHCGLPLRSLKLSAKGDGAISNTALALRQREIGAPAMAGSELKIHVTFFANAAATTLTAEELTLAQLAERVRHTSRREKKKLPWIKLAVFGIK